jgi:hypothetical protein
MRRLVNSVAALAALATPASLFVMGSATPAGATTPTSLACKKVSGTLGGKVTVSACNVPIADKLSYASASAPKGLALATGGTLTWATSKRTTTFVITHYVQAGTACKTVPNSGEVVATGHVTGGTAPRAITSLNQPVSVTVCLKKSAPYAISIAPGTTAKI